MGTNGEINFGLPPPPGARKEQFYYDEANPRQAPYDPRNQFYNNNVAAGNFQQQQRHPNSPQRRVTFSASTDGNAGGGRQQQQAQQQFNEPPSFPHTTYSPNRVLGLGARSAGESMTLFFDKKTERAGARRASRSSFQDASVDGAWTQVATPGPGIASGFCTAGIQIW